MKVLHLIDNLAPGGAERMMVHACNGLHDAGCAVEALLILGDRRELAGALCAEIPLSALERRHRADLRAAAALATRMRCADLVHAHMRHNYRYAAWVRRVFRVNTPLLLHDHYGQIERDRSVPWGLGGLLRPRWYVGVSRSLTDWAEEVLRLPPSRVFGLSNTVERAVPDPTWTVQRDFVMTANIKPAKNQLFALQVLAHMPGTLDLYGAVQDKAYAQAMHTEAERLGLSKRVRVIADCTEVPRRLHGYRIGLHTSAHESGPLAIVEYLAQGLPFVAYDTGEAAALIRSDLPEFFIDHWEAEGWASRIRQLLASPPDAVRMARVFEQHFDSKRYARQCMDLYRRILAAEGRRRVSGGAS